MKRADSANLTRVTDRLAALSDMTRLRILRLVECEALSVGELAQVVQLPQSTVSRHLKVLADAAWVVRRSEGTAGFYRLVLDDLPTESRSLWLAVREQIPGTHEVEEDQRRLRSVLAERRTDSLSFFGRFAGEWDHLRNELFGARFTSLALLSLIRSDWTIADLGCGTGNASELLAPVVERVVAVDVSGPMLEAARERLKDAPNVTFVEAVAEKLPIPDRTIDAAVAVLVLHHIADPGAFLTEAARILRAGRAGGTLLIVDMVEHDRTEYRQTMGHQHLGFSHQSMTRLLKSAGFADVNYRELPTEPDAKGPGLFVATARIN
ncbi:MAG TPA: metalloregulator ArsR/SmtB family transcription factor [Phycisphaerales bacterium]|nr:metalloregulator ArsR/SmtB family transcription factor [Phycisphaerales bacterium]